jgi:hypothetical protein
MIRTKLYGNLPAFKNLTTLILGSGSGGWVPEAYADKFLLGLPHMNHLVHFSLKYDCTENVLQVLSETCGKTLRVLDIERSRQVRDDAVPYIKSCAELVSINIFQTDLTTQGQVRASFKITTLELSIRQNSPGICYQMYLVTQQYL